jgi:hypothetical protein
MNLDDTSRCAPVASCATCAGTKALAVATVRVPIGVLCLTMCAGCTTLGRLPRFGWVEACDLVAAHCGHLGIDLDQMAALLDAEG